MISSFGCCSGQLIWILFSHFYQFQKLGDDDEELEFISTSYPSFGMENPTQPLPRAYFSPRVLNNLILADEIESLNPIIDAKVVNALSDSDAPQIFTACGRGAGSTLRTLRHGLEVEDVVSSELPYIPNAVWTTKTKEEGDYFLYFILNTFRLLNISRSIRRIYHPFFR